VITATGSAGFYGKLPAVGDFVTRHLAQDFIQPWDTWLQNSIRLSRQQMADTWLDRYLVSPVWRYLLGPGVCGPEAHIGVVLPSVDKVGRYFPFTINMPVAIDSNLLRPLVHREGWFAQAEELALDALEKDSLDMQSFEASMLMLNQQAIEDGSTDASVPHISSMLYQQTLTQIDDLSGMALDMNWHLTTTHYPLYSFWFTEGAESVSPSMMLCTGLPEPQRYATMLDGQWRNDVD
jgi:type VI secretion system protein ImpM